MSQSNFKFKQFTIQQDNCAMKVGMDAVLLGAWTEVEAVKQALDVGSGSGLIALMIAQRCSAYIDGVEIDESAFRQSIENVSKSPWSNRINIVNDSFQKFCIGSKKQYDLVVSNPPYFINSTNSPDTVRSLARHNDSLPFEDLFSGAESLLKPSGRFCIVAPGNLYNQLNDLAGHCNLHCNREMWLFPTPLKKANRILLEFSPLRKAHCKDSLVIEDKGRHNYSEAYRNLTKEFYLNF